MKKTINDFMATNMEELVDFANSNLSDFNIQIDEEISLMSKVENNKYTFVESYIKGIDPRKDYLRLVKYFHPDKETGSKGKFLVISNAWNIYNEYVKDGRLR